MVTLSRIFCQGSIQNFLQACGNFVHVIAQRRYLFFRMHHGNGNCSITIKRNFTGEHFKKHNAQRIHITTCSNMTASCLFRRKIMYGTHYSRSINHSLVAYHFSNAKICNLRVQVFIYQNILRFNITVNNIPAVSVLQSICQTHANFQHCVQRKLIVFQILF